jgi:hypothetical protein
MEAMPGIRKDHGRGPTPTLWDGDEIGERSIGHTWRGIRTCCRVWQLPVVQKGVNEDC